MQGASGQPVAEETLTGISCPPNLEELPIRTVAKMITAVSRLRRSRAPGAEGVSVELLQAASTDGIVAIHQLELTAWLQGMPSAVKCSQS